MSQPTPSYGFQKFKIIECDPSEFKRKNYWGRFRISGAKNADYFQGKLDTCSKNFYISGNFKNYKNVLTLHENSNVKYEKINPFNITTDDLNYFMLEISPTPAQKLQVLSIKLPMHVEEFKKLECFEMFKMCDYFRMDYEEPLRILFQNQKKLKLLNAEQLLELTQLVDVYPWKACFDKYVSKYDLKEAKYKGFHTFRVKYQKRVLPLYLQAIRLYSYMNEERERGNDLFSVHTLFNDYFTHWKEVAYEQNDKDMKPAFDFLMFQGLTMINDDYVGYTKDVKINKELFDNFRRLVDSKRPSASLNRPKILPKDDSGGPSAPPNHPPYSACLPSSKLSEDQLKVVKHALQNHITLLEGAPGTGKTETLVAIMSQLCMRDIGEPPRGPIVVTYIGMMVDSLQKRFGDRPETANTIHYICCKIENTTDKRVLEWIKSFTVLIIDEGSNVDVKLFGRLIRCMTGLSSIIIVGDLGQIFPIKPGCPFYDLVNKYREHSYMLTENMRVDPDAKNLAEAASHIRRGESEKVDFSTSCLQIISDRSDASFKSVVLEMVKTLDDTMRLQIVTLRKADARHLNKLYEDTLISRGILKKPKGAYNLNGCFIYPGKKIVFTKKLVSEKYDSVRNGEMGQISQIKGDILYLTNGKRVPINEVDLTTGYATTCNKAQGSEWDNVIFWIYKDPNTFFTREFPYVAVSRAKKKCVVFGTVEEFHNICRHKARERNTIFRFYLQNLEIPKYQEDIEIVRNLKLLPLGEYAVRLPPDPNETTKDDNKFSRYEYTKDRKMK